MSERLKASTAYLARETFIRKDFNLLWLTRLKTSCVKHFLGTNTQQNQVVFRVWTSSCKRQNLLRFLFLVVGSGFLAHWKNLAFTQNQNDKLVSIIGGDPGLSCRPRNYWLRIGVNGAVNFGSRMIAGSLLNKIRQNIWELTWYWKYE